MSHLPFLTTFCSLLAMMLPTAAEVPLDQALDFGSAVTWSTGGDKLFAGEPHPEAFGGSAAVVTLEWGEEAWIEAVVDGPGVFDFRLLDLPDVAPYETGSVSWFLYIDDVGVDRYADEWPPQWIAGEGPHRVRLAVRHGPQPYEEEVKFVMDQVSWIPLVETTVSAVVTGLANVEWASHSPDASHAFHGLGRSGGAAIAIPHATGEWLEARLSGPGVLEWDSLCEAAGSGFGPPFELLIDEEVKFPVYRYYDGWRRHRLSLPAGDHTIRWASTHFSEYPAPGRLRMSDFAFTPGISALAETLNAPGAVFLEVGDAGGTGAADGNGEGLWQMGENSMIYFALSGEPQHGFLEWGHPDDTPRNLGITGRGCVTSDSFSESAEAPGWNPIRISLAPNGFYQFIDMGMPGWDSTAPKSGPAPALRRLRLGPRLHVPLADLADGVSELTSETWTGLQSETLSQDGVDCAWSVRDFGSIPHTAALPVTGPAVARFWWRKSAAGTLTVKVGGSGVAVPPADDVWSERAVVIPPGAHLLEWIHDAAPSAWHGHSEAFIDGISLESLPEPDLTGAAVVTPDHPLESADGGWRLAHYADDDAWADAARCTGGSPVLSMNVSGPATLRFNGRCFPPESNPAGSGSGSNSSVTMIPADWWDTHGLSVYVDGVHHSRIEKHESAQWSSREVHLPAGTHQISWRLTANSGATGQSGVYTAANVAGLEGWLDEITVMTHAERYALWASALPADARDALADADGDGIPNVLEYAFGTDAGNTSSKPGGISLHGGESPYLLIPYLEPFAVAVIETSGDLIHWTPDAEFIKPAGPKPANGSSSAGLPTHHTLTHQAVPIEVSEGTIFYRIRISLPDPEP